jgi:hypothetical protein
MTFNSALSDQAQLNEVISGATAEIAKEYQNRTGLLALPNWPFIGQVSIVHPQSGVLQHLRRDLMIVVADYLAINMDTYCKGETP